MYLPDFFYPSSTSKTIIMASTNIAAMVVMLVSLLRRALRMTYSTATCIYNKNMELQDQKGRKAN